SPFFSINIDLRGVALFLNFPSNTFISKKTDTTRSVGVVYFNDLYGFPLELEVAYVVRIWYE
ncbi:MAG TPA: hypothetical protein PK544_17420, partial [Spirochaetota bacterium]|nr:hypothetical protein [Spirochaetota bacterium]